MIKRCTLLFTHILFALLCCTSFARAGGLEAALERAGENRAELELALSSVPESEQPGMSWLIENMPDSDLRSLSAEYLLENHRVAYQTWEQAPWRDAVGEDVFLDAVLPYASVNERRDAWRATLRERCLPMIAGAKTPGEAAAMLNNKIWSEFGVKYSTKRKKPDQSPFETMESGLASCSGLSVLLIDSCRAVGVPARFVGTPLWSDDSGNHSWVEVWDGGWQFTGAAEPTGNELNKGWFAGRAAGAKRDDPRYAIYATTWRKTPIAFPLVWLPEDRSVNAVNVTDRYTTTREPVPEGQCRVRIRVLDEVSGERVAAFLTVKNSSGDMILGATSKDESFDANDHVVVLLPIGSKAEVRAVLGDSAATTTFIASDESLQTLTLPAPLSATVTSTALPLSEIEPLRRKLWDEHAARIKRERSAELAALKLTKGELVLPFWYTTYGDKPEGGRSLFISMHGGGGAPKEVNDQQWENQKRLYKVDEGIYLAPRAATDTWNLWHQAHIDSFFDRLIEDLIVLEGVNPDRVYLTGYSAGGDGVYQLAPRMADRFAAAAMMAGHPNETKPDGLRNLPFTLHMGGEDAAYDRNKIARDWKVKLAELTAADPGGYEHHVEIHEGKGHWMDREDAVALPWMAAHTRDLRPERIVWLQDDVTHERFYWLRNPAPKARERIVVSRSGQDLLIEEATAGTQLELRLDDSMLDLDQEVVVRFGETELFRGVVPRSADVMSRTLAERGDPRGIFTAEVAVTIPAE